MGTAFRGTVAAFDCFDLDLPDFGGRRDLGREEKSLKKTKNIFIKSLFMTANHIKK